MRRAAYHGLLFLIGGLLLVLNQAAEADWRACLHDTAMDWRLPDGLALVFWAPVVPLVFLWFKPGKASWALALAFLALVLWFLTEVSAFHDCDRKSPDTFLLPFLLTLPVMVLSLLARILDQRLAK